MANRIVIDPITRIEGHLRIEAEIENGKITEAYSSSTTVRGMEKIVEGRDQGMSGLLCNVLVGFAPQYMLLHLYVQLRMH